MFVVLDQSPGPTRNIAIVHNDSFWVLVVIKVRGTGRHDCSQFAQQIGAGDQGNIGIVEDTHLYREDNGSCGRKVMIESSVLYFLYHKTLQKTQWRAKQITYDVKMRCTEMGNVQPRMTAKIFCRRDTEAQKRNH